MRQFTRRITTDDFARFLRETADTIESKYAIDAPDRKAVAEEIVSALRLTARDIEHDRV